MSGPIGEWVVPAGMFGLMLGPPLAAFASSSPTALLLLAIAFAMGLGVPLLPASRSPHS